MNLIGYYEVDIEENENGREEYKKHVQQME